MKGDSKMGKFFDWLRLEFMNFTKQTNKNEQRKNTRINIRKWENTLIY